MLLKWFEASNETMEILSVIVMVWYWADFNIRNHHREAVLCFTGPHNRRRIKLFQAKTSGRWRWDVSLPRAACSGISLPFCHCMIMLQSFSFRDYFRAQPSLYLFAWKLSDEELFKEKQLLIYNAVRCMSIWKWVLLCSDGTYSHP